MYKEEQNQHIQELLLLQRVVQRINSILDLLVLGRNESYNRVLYRASIT